MRAIKLPKIVPSRKYLLIIALVITLVGWFVHTVTLPVKGHLVPVDVKLNQSAHTAAPPQPLDATVQSTYFTLDLPAGYRAQEGSTAVPGLLYQQTLIKPSLAGSLIISITVKNMPAGGLDGESSYQWRSGQGEHFLIGKKPVGSDTVTLANDTKSASVLAYWPHGTYLATISITSGVDNPAVNDNNDEITALQPLLKGWRWQP